MQHDVRLVYFSDFLGLRMHACSLIPRPNTTIIGLGTRLVHKQNRMLTTRTAGMVSSCSGGMVNEHHIGKALHSAANL